MYDSGKENRSAFVSKLLKKKRLREDRKADLPDRSDEREKRRGLREGGEMRLYARPWPASMHRKTARTLACQGRVQGRCTTPRVQHEVARARQGSGGASDPVVATEAAAVEVLPFRDRIEELRVAALGEAVPAVVQRRGLGVIPKASLLLNVDLAHAVEC